MALKVYEGAFGSKFVCDDTRGFGDALAEISIRAEAPILSCAREPNARKLLSLIGKKDQAKLFACSLHCTADCGGDCNPANPPGRSTHERRSDGVAYAGPRGRWLRYWQRGIDVRVDRVAAFIAESAKEKWIVTQTYPSSVAEAHHVNFRRAPVISLWEFRPLSGGETGRRALRVIRYLSKIQRPGTRTPYLQGDHDKYGVQVQRAVKDFQQDHHIKADGTVGLRTFSLLRGTARRPPSRLDEAGIEFLIAHEGEVLYAYNDPAGHATFGVGHLLHRGAVTSADILQFGSRDRRKDPEMMRRRSRGFLDEDARRFERAVVQHVPVGWRRSHDRFNAFVSLAFNLGEEILTPDAPLRSVGQALQGTSVSALITAVLLFDKAGSPPHPMAGLTVRRKHEADLIQRNK